MAAPAPFDLKRAGLLFRDAATVLCGTLLVEFITEQADCLEKRLKPVLEVLPGVETELEVFKCDWRGLREDIQTLLEACARFKADPPATGVCDYLAELYEPKKRAYTQLMGLKNEITSRVKAAEAEVAAVAARAARVKAEAAARKATGLEAADEVDLPIVPIRLEPPEGQDQQTSSAGGVSEMALLLSTAHIEPHHSEGATQRKKTKKPKKKKPAKQNLLFERLVLRVREDEDGETFALEGRRLALQSALDTAIDESAAVSDAFLPVARHIIATAISSTPNASPALTRQRAASLCQAAVYVGSLVIGDDDPLRHERTAAFILAVALFKDYLAIEPKDDFARWDYAFCLYEVMLAQQHEPSTSTRVLKARELVQLLRSLHLHRYHYAPLRGTEPEHSTSMLIVALGELARLLHKSDPAGSLRVHSELLAIPLVAYPVATGTRQERDRRAAIRCRCDAIEAIADSHIKSGDLVAAGVQVAVNPGVTVESMTDIQDDEDQLSWYRRVIKLYERIAVLHARKLGRMQAVWRTSAKAFASQGGQLTEEEARRAKEAKESHEQAEEALVRLKESMAKTSSRIEALTKKLKMLRSRDTAVRTAAMKYMQKR